MVWNFRDMEKDSSKAVQASQGNFPKPLGCLCLRCKYLPAAYLCQKLDKPGGNMNTPLVIQKLNEAISLELAGFQMYLQFSLLVHGQERIKWHEFFEKQSGESVSHAKTFGKKVVALGGIPTIERAQFDQAQDLEEMLELALEHEKRAVTVYSEAHSLVEGEDKPLQFLLENQILDEQNDVEELDRFLRREKLSVPEKRSVARVA